MAIAYDTAGSGTGGEAATTATAASIAATGANRCAIIVAGWFSDTYSTPTVTVGGSSTGVTQIGTTIEDAPDTRLKMAIWRLVAPPTSASNYVATWGGGVDMPVIGVATYTGVDQTNPITGSLVKASGSSTTPSATISSAAGELVIASAQGGYPAYKITEDGGQTERIALENWSGSGHSFSLCEEAGAASVTESWTITSAVWTAVAVRLAAASGATIVPQAMANYRMRAA